MTQQSPHYGMLEHARRLAEQRRQRSAPRSVDVAAEFRRARTRGDRAADTFAQAVGSWKFIGSQTAVLTAWVVLNAVAAVHRWDPYPFILLNLVLSFQAAYAAPIIMMSQNRAANLDRMVAQADYLVNQHAETEVEEVLALLHAHTDLLERLTAELTRERGESGAARRGSPGRDDAPRGDT